ncbi:hypothetical protein F511_14612 [Dorcoceras hygrometricum]|uniref:Uncharacterized protein n=1 Tax=Dorcoceras hygrometricum TaxID=472368 RepID=A0A2Z7D127_9LAMI|nr:hypothetical protein F511_14612 [Dorcoceras hygrometricum]
MLYSKLQSRNDTVPTKRNDATAFYQQATISLAKNQMLVVEFPSKPISSWLRKSTQNDDASTNLDNAVLDMPHRYQLLVNPAGIHPSQRFKTSSCTYPNDVAAPKTTSSCTKETPAAGFYMQKQYSPRVTCSWILSIVRANHQPPAATRIKRNDWNSKFNQSQATVVLTRIDFATVTCC